MAKEKKIEQKKETVEVKEWKEWGKDKVVKTTTEAITKNLDAEKKILHEKKALEKQQADLDLAEKSAAAEKEDTAKQIEEKKQALEQPPVIEKKEVTVESKKKEEKGDDKDAKWWDKKGKKWDRNPGNRLRHISTRALSGIVALPSRIVAKGQHIIARPQQLWSKWFWKDIGKNIMRTPAAIWTTISGAVYRPHRDKVKFENNFKDYGPEFANPTDTSKLVRWGKNALWFAGKVAAPTLTAWVWSIAPKFFANISRGANHFLHEAAEGLRDSKWHRNPKNRNLKPWKFSKTREAFAKAFSSNKKWTPAVSHSSHKKKTKIIDISPKETKETTVIEEAKAA